MRMYVRYHMVIFISLSISSARELMIAKHKIVIKLDILHHFLALNNHQYNLLRGKMLQI